MKAKRLPSPKVLISPLKGHHSVAPQGPTINPLTRRSVPQEKRSNSPGAKSSLSAPLSRDVASQKQKQGRALSVTSLESEPSFRPSFGRKGPRLVTQAAPSGETLPPSGVTPLGTSGQGSRPVPRSLAPRSGPIPPLWGPDGTFSGQGFVPPPLEGKEGVQGGEAKAVSVSEIVSVRSPSKRKMLASAGVSSTVTRAPVPPVSKSPLARDPKPLARCPELPAHSELSRQSASRPPVSGDRCPVMVLGPLKPAIYSRHPRQAVEKHPARARGPRTGVFGHRSNSSSDELALSSSSREVRGLSSAHKLKNSRPDSNVQKGAENQGSRHARSSLPSARSFLPSARTSLPDSRYPLPDARTPLPGARSLPDLRKTTAPFSGTKAQSGPLKTAQPEPRATSGIKPGVRAGPLSSRRPIVTKPPSVVSSLDPEVFGSPDSSRGSSSQESRGSTPVFQRPVRPVPQSTPIPHTAGSQSAQVVMGPPVVPQGPDRQTQALIAAMRAEIESLRDKVDASQEAAQARNEDAGSDDEEVEKSASKRRMRAFRRFVGEILPGYVPQPDPDTLGSHGIALSNLDASFDEERRATKVEHLLDSALPLSPLLGGIQNHLDRFLQGSELPQQLYCLDRPLSEFNLSRSSRGELDRVFKPGAPQVYGCNTLRYRVRASQDSPQSYLIAPPVPDRDFALFAASTPSSLKASLEEVMLREQLGVLSYVDYALAAGLSAVDQDPDDQVLRAKSREAIKVGLRAIEHASSITQKVVGNMELSRRTQGLKQLPFDSETKSQLRCLPLGHEELFGGKLEEASTQALERAKRQRELRADLPSSKPPPAKKQKKSGTQPRGKGKGKGSGDKGKGKGPSPQTAPAPAPVKGPSLAPQASQGKPKGKKRKQQP